LRKGNPLESTERSNGSHTCLRMSHKIELVFTFNFITGKDDCQDLGRCIELQVRLLAKYLTGEIDEYPPFLVR
jgi:hypothetical protein